MGQFSWMYADHNNEKALKCDGSGYVICPDGTTIYEPCYDGYGRFDGHDIYELVVDWNRELMTSDMITKYMSRSEILTAAKRLNDWKSGKFSEEEMDQKYGNHWKRYLGIDIACYDECNAALPYPIKISSRPDVNYADLPASKGDPNQGW